MSSYEIKNTLETWKGVEPETWTDIQIYVWVLYSTVVLKAKLFYKFGLVLTSICSKRIALIANSCTLELTNRIHTLHDNSCNN